MRNCPSCGTEYSDLTHFCPRDGSALRELSPGDLPTGARVAEYTILSKLGSGGFGHTYLVEDTELARRAVLKLIESTSAEAADQLRREYNLLQRFDNPAFARVYRVGTWENHPFLLTEWVAGQTLDTVLQASQRLSLSDGAAVAIRLARGLGRLHEAGFVHRDIKPLNVMIPGTPNDHRFQDAKLLDFGVFGTLMTQGNERHTMAGYVVGTPRYMSPEQIQAQSQTPASDVYGVALLLYEMLYGGLPFEDEGDSAIAMMVRVLQSDAAIPEDASVPEPLRDLLSRSLSRDPRARPSDGDAFADELIEIIGESPDIDWVARIPAMSAQPTLLEAPTGRYSIPKRRVAATEPSKSARGLWWPAVMGTVVTATALTIVFALILSRGSGSGPGPQPVPPPRPGNLLAATAWIALGIAIAIAGFFLGRLVRRLVRARMHDVEVDAERLLLGLSAKRALTQTIQVEITEIIRRCRELDDRVLGITILQMISEYDKAKASDQRQSALMNVAALLEKLRGRLSPWYARFDRQLAFATQILAIAGGLVGVVTGVVKLMQGAPPNAP